jgi:hypothetical protein
MKLDTIRKRPAKDRPMVPVTLRMPADGVEDLKRIAPWKGFSGYQALIRAYVGAGLREDEDRERYETPDLAAVLERLRQQGVPEETLKKALQQIA